MKRVVIIGLLALYVFSATELRELLKLPMLIEHFTEHKNNRSDISFFDFISLHYINIDQHGAENAHDHTLPFKAHDNCHAINAQLAKLPEYECTICPAETPVQKTFPLSNEPTYSSYSATIWQPPKLL